MSSVRPAMSPTQTEFHFFRNSMNLVINIHRLFNIPNIRVPCSSGVSVSVFDVGIGIRYFCRYFFTSVRYSVSVF